MTDDTRLVYSTESGRICPACGKPQSGCACKGKKRKSPAPSPEAAQNDGIVRIRKETKGRKGKMRQRGLRPARRRRDLETDGQSTEKPLRHRRLHKRRRHHHPGRPPAENKSGTGKTGTHGETGRRVMKGTIVSLLAFSEKRGIKENLHLHSTPATTAYALSSACASLIMLILLPGKDNEH